MHVDGSFQVENNVSVVLFARLHALPCCLSTFIRTFLMFARFGREPKGLPFLVRFGVVRLALPCQFIRLLMVFCLVWVCAMRQSSVMRTQVLGIIIDFCRHQESLVIRAMAEVTTRR